MVNDPCAPVPDTNIPSGLAPSHHHAIHRVVGRIRHTVPRGHAHVAGLPKAAVLEGCDKPGPGAAKLSSLPAGPFPPASKLAAAGGVIGTGFGTVAAVGGLGGLISGFTGGSPGKKITKVSFTPPGGTPDGPNPVPTPPGIVPPSTPPVTTPPTSVPEPSTLIVFAFAVCVALVARRFLGRPARTSPV